MKLRMGICLATVVLLTIFAPGVSGADDLLMLENKYIKIFINNSQDETGRFALDVTAGDPHRSDDDNRPLIYGHPKPWTSYTTVRINGQNYVFGKATFKRPGAKLPDGKIIAPPQIEDNQITMSCQFGAVVVKQLLDLTKSPSTGALDTARIRYVIHNTGTDPVEVGLRTVFDTLVGANDGAPFRVGNREITEDTALGPEEFPDFWQAFDSLDQPSVIAQGTLKGGDVTTPDRLLFTNWGKAADYPWEIPLEPGAKFIRAGEEELDSVVAMFWFPRTIAPDSTETITIYYGLGGVTFSPGNTFLGISAPAEVQHLGEETHSYTVIMYMEHRGEAKARNVTINLDLPAGLSLVSGEPQLTLAELTPGVTKQIAWHIKPDGMYYGDSSFQIRVVGEGLEPNQVTRAIKISGPIALGATMTLPKLEVVNNQWEPNPFAVKLNLKNLDVKTAWNLKAVFSSDSGLRLAEGERSEKILNEVDPGKETAISWMLTPQRQANSGRFKISVRGSNVLPLDIPGVVTIPALPANLSFSNPGTLRIGQLFSVTLDAANLDAACEFVMDLKYNPDQLRLISVSRGTFLVEDQKLSAWSKGMSLPKEGKVAAVTGRRNQPFTGETTTLVRLNFMAIGPGDTTVEVSQLTLRDAKGKKLPYQFKPVKYQIVEEKQ